MRSFQIRRLAKAVSRLHRQTGRAGRIYGRPVSNSSTEEANQSSTPTRDAIKRELIYRYESLTNFAFLYGLNVRQVWEFIGGRNNNKRVLEALKKEGFENIKPIGGSRIQMANQKAAA